MNLPTALQLLKENDYKVTKRREDIIQFFAKDDKYRTAKDLYEYMESKYPGISYDTVYRNLHLYHSLGILETTDLEAEKHFRMTCGEHHHHHFICKMCGYTKKLNFCPMEIVNKFLKKYIVDDHKFEVYGFCPSCHGA